MTSPVANRRVTLVTGSSAGLGLTVARSMQESGDIVHVTHRRPEQAGALNEHFPGRTHRVDLSQAAAARNLVARIMEQETRLDVLVHAVGPYFQGSLEETPAHVFRDLVATNLFTAVELVDAARPALRLSQGTIVLFGVSGLAGQRARRTNAAYVAAKAALRSYGRSLALEEAPHGLRVNLVSPGVVPHAGASSDTLDPAVQAEIPMGRPGTPEDIAAAVAYLCSPAAAHVTGQDLEVAGGYML